MKGTTLLGVAESKDAILEMLKGDAYWMGGVWDAEKVQILPFKTFLRKGLEGGL